MSYQRRKVLAGLSKHGIDVLREGGSHTIVGREGGPRTSLPRHKELDRRTVRKIVQQLGLEWDRVEGDIA